MLLIILTAIISLSQAFADTIELKGTQNIYYRAFINESTLCFQYKTNKNWSASKIIDENVSEYAMTVTSGDYIHLVWVKQGRVYYKMNMYPVTKDSLKKNGTPRWECNIAISPYFTEPASNLAIYTKDGFLNVIWQVPLEGYLSQVENWRRARWLGNTPFDWEEPQNISPNEMPTFDIPHSSNNRDPIQMKRISFLQVGLTSTADGKLVKM